MEKAENFKESNVIDLIEYRLERYVESFYKGTDERQVASQLLMMYLIGEIDVRWSSKSIVVEHPSLNFREEETSVNKYLLPLKGPKEVR